MSGIRTRSEIKALVAANLPSGLGSIAAVDHREVQNSGADSYAFKGDIEVRVISMALTAPPGSESDQDAYVPAATATGTWAGKEGQVAIWDEGLSPAAYVFVVPTDGQAVFNLADDTQYRWDAGLSPSAWVAVGVPFELIIALGDETTAITTGTNKVKFRMPFAATLTAVRASLSTTSSSGIPTVDINEAGVTVLSTKLTIDASETTSTTAATPAVISDSALADDAEISFDIDVAGTGAAGLKVTLIGTRA